MRIKFNATGEMLNVAKIKNDGVCTLFADIGHGTLLIPNDIYSKVDDEVSGKTWRYFQKQSFMYDDTDKHIREQRKFELVKAMLTGCAAKVGVNILADNKWLGAELAKKADEILDMLNNAQQ